MTHAAESSGARDAASEREEPAEPWTAKLGVALVVALVTGVITIGGAIGGQWVAKNWQSREHEHELKSQLATEMSDAFTAPVLTAQSIATGLIARHITNPERHRVAVNLAYERGLRSWRLRSARVGTEIEVHFPTDVRADWATYAAAVTDLYRLSATGFSTADRRRWIAAVRAALGRGANAINWSTLAVDFRTPTFNRAFLAASESLLGRGDYLVQSILEHPVTNL